MPTPRENEEKSDFISRCVKEVMDEGKSQEQALGQCYGVWRQHRGQGSQAMSQYSAFAKAWGGKPFAMKDEGETSDDRKDGGKRMETDDPDKDERDKGGDANPHSKAQTDDDENDKSDEEDEDEDEE